MEGYITTAREFITKSNEQIIESLKSIYPKAEKRQIDSWKTLIEDIKGADSFKKMPQDCVIAVEYSLPTDGMAADLILSGCTKTGEKCAFIIESKQWNDQMVYA